MKLASAYIAIVLLVVFFVPQVQSQTLGEVLRAVQKRRQLRIDRGAVAQTFSDRIAESVGDDPSPLINIDTTTKLIDWGLQQDYPTDEQLDALPVTEQLRLLKLCWRESGYPKPDIPGRKITLENFSYALRLLAGLVRRDTIAYWPIMTSRSYEGYSSDDLGSLPNPPLDLTTLPNQENNEDYLGKPEIRYGVGLCTTIGGGKKRRSTEHAEDGPDKYTWGGILTNFDNITTIAPQSFSGKLKVSRWSGYAINEVAGLSEEYYRPETVLVSTTQLSSEDETSLDDFTFPLDGTSFQGTWITDPPDPNNPYASEPNTYFDPKFQDQTTPKLYEDMYEYFDPDEFFGPYLLDYGIAFEPDYGSEFAATATAAPEQGPELRVELDAFRQCLTLRLASDPLNDCILSWKPVNAWFERNALSVSGSGNWDAVYSGKKEDREGVITWPVKGSDPYGRWANFGEYFREWWTPVLTQLKTATYGLNITQQGNYSYKIDFYFAAQMGEKDQTTHRYSPTGTPLESWTVVDPGQNDTEKGKIEITTSKAIYDLVIPAGGTASPVWTWTIKDKQSSTTLLSETVALSGAYDSEHKQYLQKIVRSATLDSHPLSTVTTTYWDVQHLDKVVETSTDGTVTTTYAYVWKTNESGDTSLDHLTNITRIGDTNPYSEEYNDNELLTKYTAAATSILISYDGATVTRTEQFNSQTVRVLTTTYTDGLATVTTTISGATDAPAAETKFYPGTDGVRAWRLKLTRSFDGTLTTYSYAWSGTPGTSNFVTTIAQGPESSVNPGTVDAGTTTIIQTNNSGYVFSTVASDIESGIQLNYSTSGSTQTGTPFPTGFVRPFGTAETYTYNTQGQVTDFTNNLGITTTYTRDALGRLAKAVRGDVTESISYNTETGLFGPFITWSAPNQNNRTQDEETSPFGLTQTVTATGPENITATRTMDLTSKTVTTTTQNFTTAQSTTEVLNTDTLASSITGNATEPWSIAYSIPTSGGRKKTVTHGSDSALTATTTYDALGRVLEEDTPSPTGSGTVSTTYGYTGGRLTSATDPSGITNYAYQSDGSLGTTSRGNRFVAVARYAAGTGLIGWKWTNAATETFWQRTFNPSTGVTVDSPWGQSTRAVTSRPTVNGNTLSLASTGPDGSGSASWQDGLPTGGSFTGGGATTSWTAQGNAFGEVTSQTIKPGNAAYSQTTTLDALGLPSTDSGLVNATYTNTFPGGTFTSQVSRHGHTLTSQVSPKGDDLGASGFGMAAGTWTLPNYGGAITKTLNSSALPQQFTYNLAGQLLQRGFPDGTSESFEYNGGGQMATWKPPGQSFELVPNSFGQPTKIGDMGTLGYDLAGRVNAVSNTSDTTTQSYKNGQLWVEAHTAGLLNGQSVDREYYDDGRLKDINLPLTNSVHYAYNADGSLGSVTTASGLTGTWSNFDPVTGQGQNFTLRPAANGSSAVLSTTSAWDGLGHNVSRTSTVGGATWIYTHHFDEDGHCDGAPNTPDGAWTYGYDGNGWLSSAQLGSNPARNYSFDAAGRSNGNATDYRPNARFNSPLVTLFGTVAPGAMVNVKGPTLPTSGANLTPDLAGGFTLDIAGVPSGWQAFTTRGTLAHAGYNNSDAVAETVNQIYVPAPTESLTYDGTAGHRTGDTRWTNGWDALDRLTTITELTPVPDSSGARVIYCSYDLQGRRIEKKIVQLGQLVLRTTTLWDGWLPVMDVDWQAGTEVARRYYTWGPDVSGSIGGAAGIGGLLEILEYRGSGNSAMTLVSLPIYDGTGNVVGLVDGTTGARVATYQYGPWGEVQRIGGERASSCPFRFQTKRYDEEVGLYYFGKRYYDPKTQSWLSRDPMREGGGVNLYAYCGNDPVTGHDPIGLDDHWPSYRSNAWDDFINIFWPGYVQAKSARVTWEHRHRKPYPSGYDLMMQRQRLFEQQALEYEQLGDRAGTSAEKDLEDKYNLLQNSAIFQHAYIARNELAEAQPAMDLGMLVMSLTPATLEFAEARVFASRISLELSTENSAFNGIRARGMSGLRSSRFNILGHEDITRLTQEFEEIGGDVSMLRFNQGQQTAYINELNIINVRGDVMPAYDGTTARATMSSRAVLAHEFYGHAATRGTSLAPQTWNDEFRASYRASRFSLGLSNAERRDLMLDALSRAQDAGFTIRTNRYMIDILYGEE